MGDLKYGEFEFPSDRGFTGSAGKSQVRGYMRGGKVKGKTVGVTTERGPKSSRPKANMTKAAQGGSVHDKLYDHGAQMGFARGGQVKDTSGEFNMKAKPQDTMDSGVQPARKGRNQAEIEAGGTKRLKPKFKKGGKASKPKVHKTRLVKKAEGGSVNKPSAGMLGGGGAAEAARAMRSREERVKSTVNEALASAKASTSGGSPKPRARKVDQAPKPKSDKIYREDKDGVPTFTDVPKSGTRVKARGGRVGKRGAAR